MVVQIQTRRDTAANWTANNPILAAGEKGYETDTGKLKIGDGSTAWNSLAYFGSTWDKHNVIAAGTQTAITSGTVVFSNSNGVTFGMSNSSIVTASHNGITSQTNQSLGVYATSNTTLSSSGTIDARSLTFKGDGIVSVGVSNGSVVISATGGGGGGSPNISAGTTSNNLGTIVFSNSNGVSFGLNGSTITASHNGLTTMLTHNSVYHSGTIFPGTDQYVGSAFMEYGTTTPPSTPAAGRMREYAFAENGKIRHAVITPDGTSYTMEQDEYITVHNNTGSTIAKGKWVYITGQSSGVTTIDLASQDSSLGQQAIGVTLESIANGSDGRVQLRGIATNLDTSAFIAGDALILGTSGNPTTTTPSQSVILQYIGLVLVSHATAGKILLFPFQVPVYGQEYYFTSPDIAIGNTASTRVRIDLTVSNKIGEIQWAGTNNRTFHLPDSTVANATFMTNFNVSAGTTSNNLSALTFSDSNGVSFGLNGSVVTATVKTDYLTSQSNQAVSAANGSYAFQTLSFSNANGVSFGTSAGSAVTASHNGLTSQSNQAFSAQGGSSAFQTLSFNNANGATFSNNGGAVEVSYTRPVVSNAVASVGSATNSGTNTSRFAADDHVHAGVFSIGVSNVGNTSGDTRVDVGRFVFAGGNNITLSQGTAANALNTITISAANQSNQSLGIYALGNTTGQSSSSTYDARTLSLEGAGIVSVGWSNGSVRVSATQSNQAFSAAGGSSAFQTLGFSDNAYASWTNTNGSVALTELRGSFFATNNTTQSSSGTINLDSVIFRGEGIASVGVSNGSVVVSVPSGGGAGDGYNIVQIGTTGTTGTSWSSATATVQLNGSNGITVSQNNSNQIVISGDGVTLSNYSRFFGELSLAGTVMANSNVSIIPFEIPNHISISQFMFGGSVSVASAVNTSSAYQDISQSVVIYTRDGTSLGSVASGSVTATYTWTSNATASIGGRRLYTVPLGGVLLTPGQYWAAVYMSTTNTATGGAATTALGASHSLFLAGSVNTNWFGWNPIGSATSDFGQGVAFGLGAISTGATLSTLAFSSITQTGTRAVNANLVFVLRNYNYP